MTVGSLDSLRHYEKILRKGNKTHVNKKVEELTTSFWEEGDLWVYSAKKAEMD